MSDESQQQIDWEQMSIEIAAAFEPLVQWMRDFNQALLEIDWDRVRDVVDDADDQGE